MLFNETKNLLFFSGMNSSPLRWSCWVGFFLVIRFSMEHHKQVSINALNCARLIWEELWLTTGVHHDQYLKPISHIKENPVFYRWTIPYPSQQYELPFHLGRPPKTYSSWRDPPLFSIICSPLHLCVWAGLKIPNLHHPPVCYPPPIR